LALNNLCQNKFRRFPSNEKNRNFTKVKESKKHISEVRQDSIAILKHICWSQDIICPSDESETTSNIKPP